MLCNLYKTEPNNKKIYDMLSNDFTQDRWMKAADKNAMVLISKKNYELGITFFILAGKIDDAINVAISKLNDLNLAILISRLITGINSEKTLSLIDKHFIEYGKLMQDPWLVSIGYWWKSKYFDAINNLSSMIGEAKSKVSQQIFNKAGLFNLYKPNVVYKFNSPSAEQR